MKDFLIHFCLFFFNNCVREIFFADSVGLFVSKTFFSLQMSSSAFITRSMTPYSDKRNGKNGVETGFLVAAQEEMLCLMLI
jgi:hypothetical protein